MRYAIISDIHSNWEALTAVRKECQKLKMTTLLCVGDIVGYGANPKECLEFIQKNKIASVAGNHDWAVCGRLDYSHFTPDGKAAIEWSRPRLSFEEITYLAGLPLVFRNNDFMLVHASLQDPEHFHYMFEIEDVIEAFSLMDRAVCFTGHTHIPGIFIESLGRVYRAPGAEAEIQPNCKYMVNVGSVGQPRDGNPLASYGIFDTGTQMIEIKRVPYDIPTAQKKIIEAGLPHALADRLAKGL